MKKRSLYAINEHFESNFDKVMNKKCQVINVSKTERETGVLPVHTKPNSQAKGFTLLELLVVLLILSIITAVAVMSFRHFGSARRLRLMVENTQSVVLAARLRAMLQPAVLALVTTPTGYRFYSYWHDNKTGTGAWKPLRQDDLSNRTAYAGARTIRIQSALTQKKKSGIWSVSLPSDFSFGHPPPHIHPAVLFLPDGQVTLFVLTVSDAKQHYRLSVDGHGQTQLKTHIH